MKEQTSTQAKASDPGPLEKESQWKDWEEKFTNYCRAHIGAAGVPLSYVIRTEEFDSEDDGRVFPDFISEAIACAPLAGEYYTADRSTVFNFLVSFTTGHPSGDWIKDTINHSDGRRSMTALRDHFSGEGNVSRCLSEADRLKEHLHYKSERSMPFETYMTQCQKMHNIYKKEKKEMSEDAKIRFLFKSVVHPDLSAPVAALRVQHTTKGDLTYTQCCNHLTTAVSALPESTSRNRNVSGVASDPGGSPSIYNTDGTINTGHIDHWHKIPLADRKKVYAERKKLGIKYDVNKRSGEPSSTSSTSALVNQSNTIKQLKATMKKQKRTIKSLKRRNISEGKEDINSDSDADAGDQFGGMASKKKKMMKPS